MDLARAGNLFHQDSELTRLLQSSREWIISSDDIWWHSLMATTFTLGIYKQTLYIASNHGDICGGDVGVREPGKKSVSGWIERSMATDGWHLRLKDRIRTGVNQSELLESRIAVETSPCAWIPLEGTYVLNMESCLQHPSRRPKGVWNSEPKTLWVPFLQKGLQHELSLGMFGVPWWCTSNPAAFKENHTKCHTYSVPINSDDWRNRTPSWAHGWSEYPRLGTAASMPGMHRATRLE